MMYPEVQEVFYQDPLAVFSQFAHRKGSIFLDSAQFREDGGRYSFIAVDPFLVLSGKNSIININNGAQGAWGRPLQQLAENLARFPLGDLPDLPPFQGGAVGWFSYNLYRYLENINGQQVDDTQFPDLALGFYDLVLAFDHLQQRAWIFASGYPLREPSQRQWRARKRIEWLQAQLNHVPSFSRHPAVMVDEKDLQVNFTVPEYQAAVRRAIEYILAGDIFQVNIAQRFKALVPDGFQPFDLYSRLRQINPALFAAYLNLADTVIASASPERFLKLMRGQVETRPIKGTRPRGRTQAEDERLTLELVQSEKDHAENVMIVDLLRNDLSRVCQAHSVKVLQLCGLESYATVHHLVSVVMGQLQENLGAMDVLAASFPGGSVTGAPKIRAMEIIAEIEPTVRGPYCGSVIWLGFNGNMDSSIIIRTYTIKNNTLIFQAGGAVTADSYPWTEYEEMLTKAAALKKALYGSAD